MRHAGTKSDYGREVRAESLQVGDQTITVLHSKPPRGNLNDWFNLLAQAFLLASVVGLAAFSFLTWRDWQSGMTQIETGLGEISGNLQARIEPPPMPELRRMSGSINDLAANLEKNLRRRKELENSLINYPAAS